MGKQTGTLIGCGAVAREHLIALAKLGIEVAAVCDLSAAKAESTAERFGIKKWYTSHERLLADVRPDLVHITTPPSSHFSIAQNCLAAGLNVLCEKPITRVYSEFCALKQLATENHCVLMETQQIRYHSSIQRIQDLIKCGKFGDLIDLEIYVSVNIVAPGSPFSDVNAPHFGMALRGGVIGDFLPHIAYLVYMFAGAVVDLRTIWRKHTADSPLPADEFCALIKGKRATAYVNFSGNAQPDGFWLRIAGTKMRVEADIFEPPRLTIRRLHPGEPALGFLVDGIGESRDVLWGTVAAFWRKLGATNSFDGLSEFLAKTYRAIELGEPQPVSIDEIDDIARLVENFTKPECNL